MTKIITAIAEENILKKIIKNKLVENKNILYREAIIDMVKKDKKIDVIIISEKIPGEINLVKLLKNIKKINKKIKIIIILENKKIEEELNKINIIDIYYNNIFSIYKLIKNLKENNHVNLKNNIIKIINNIFRSKKEKLMKNKNNVICIFGENRIDKKIIELIIEKNLLIKDKKLIIINLKINSKKKTNKKLIKINKTKNNYYLIMKKNYKIKEKTIDKNVKEIININSILKNKNNLIKIKIVKEIIKKYIKNNCYIIFNINSLKKKINKIPILLRNINYIILENNIINLLKIQKYKNKNMHLIIINYHKNNLSKYFYKIILRNQFKKIRIINMI